MRFFSKIFVSAIVLGFVFGFSHGAFARPPLSALSSTPGPALQKYPQGIAGYNYQDVGTFPFNIYPESDFAKVHYEPRYMFADVNHDGFKELVFCSYDMNSSSYKTLFVNFSSINKAFPGTTPPLDGSFTAVISHTIDGFCATDLKEYGGFYAIAGFRIFTGATSPQILTQTSQNNFPTQQDLIFAGSKANLVSGIANFQFLNLIDPLGMPWAKYDYIYSIGNPPKTATMYIKLDLSLAAPQWVERVNTENWGNLGNTGPIAGVFYGNLEGPNMPFQIDFLLANKRYAVAEKFDVTQYYLQTGPYTNVPNAPIVWIKSQGDVINLHEQVLLGDNNHNGSLEFATLPRSLDTNVTTWIGHQKGELPLRIYEYDPQLQIVINKMDTFLEVNGIPDVDHDVKFEQIRYFPGGFKAAKDFVINSGDQLQIYSVKDLDTLPSIELKKQILGAVPGSTFIGDLDGDGKKEIVFPASGCNSNYPQGQMRIVEFN